MGRPRVDEHQRNPKPARGSDLDLRGPSRILAQEGGPVPLLPGDSRAAGGAREQARLYPPRVASGDGASLLWIVGLSDHWLLRTYQPVWEPSGPDVPDRSAPSGRRGGH